MFNLSKTCHYGLRGRVVVRRLPRTVVGLLIMMRDFAGSVTHRAMEDHVIMFMDLREEQKNLTTGIRTAHLQMRSAMVEYSNR